MEIDVAHDGCESFSVGKDLARLVRWQQAPDANWVCGIVEAQKPGWLRIYIFNKVTHGTKRAVKRRDEVLFS